MKYILLKSKAKQGILESSGMFFASNLTMQYYNAILHCNIAMQYYNAMIKIWCASSRSNHNMWVNFPDITLNLKDTVKSNSPYRIIKQIPNDVNKRIFSHSTDLSSFHSPAPFYKNALNHNHYNTKMKYSPDPTNNSSSPPWMKHHMV